MNIDPFTPWQEDPRVLAARSVSLDEPLTWLTASCEAFLAGKRPTWCLVVGPRGAGKSHLLQLARSRLIAPQAVTWIGEDTAITPDAEELWVRLWGAIDPWGWTDAPSRPERRILFVEGLDRLVGGLRGQGAWTLRHHLQEQAVHLVGTALGADFATGEGSAFFGQLDTWALEPLGEADARKLFVQVSGETERTVTPATLTRREALVRLAGGSPRAVLTLAEAVRGTDGAALGTAEGLLGAVQRLVPHYQQRFHDLPPLGQRIVEILAGAPRELTASEVQAQASASSAAVAGTAKAMEAAGALRRVPDADDARVSRYTLAEPLFRYWLEYRSTPSWNQARAAWIGRLLGEVLARQDLADVWWAASGGELREAIGEVRDVEPTGIAIRGFANGVDGAGAREAFKILLRGLATAPGGVSRAHAQEVSRLVAGAGGRPWKLTTAERSDLARIPYLRARFAIEGRRPTHPPLLRWTELATIEIGRDTPDLPELLSAGHHRGDSSFFTRCAIAAAAGRARLEPCPHPELPAAAPDLVAPIFGRGPADFTWAASVAGMSEAVADAALASLSRCPEPPAHLLSSEMSALLALATRERGRFDVLVASVPARASVVQATRTLRQLDERARGRLQPDLELVWRAVSPKPGGR